MLLVSSAAAGPGMPIFFAANLGQAPKAVRFMAKEAGLTAYFLPHEILLGAQGTWFHVGFEAAGNGTRVEGAGPLRGRVNFLIGEPRDWHRDIPTFQSIRYRELYPGIDMTYAGNGIQMKSEFVVAPGADPSRIRIHYEGAAKPEIEPGGWLSVRVGRLLLRESAPYVYQERNGVVLPVEGRYVLAENGAVRFALGRYDRTRPLVIDPVCYTTLIGNTGFNAGTAIAVDSAGATYIAGYTDSTSLPTAMPAQNFNAGSNNAFVAKVEPTGNSLEYCTYMGGSQSDEAYAIAVDGSGAAYVAGSTTSPNFPTLHAEQSDLRGSRNAFVFKLNPLGDMLEFSTYLGGNGADQANGIALDGVGNIYLVGDTTSSNFPASAFQTSYQGSQDAFVAKFGANGGQLSLSTYLGGSGTDHGAAIAVDGTGTIYVTGSTWSANFPVKNAFQHSNAGYSDAFIARLSADGDTLIFSSYLGGSGGQMGYPETGQGIALDTAGDAYVVGVTSSSNFPMSNAIQPQLEGFTDTFVTEVNSAGAMLFSTYMGGSGVDIANAVALDASGAVYVAGYTYSTDFPVTAGAAQTVNAGGCDAFLFKLSPAGDLLLYATYLGGTGNDTASGVALDPSGNAYLSGWTMSANFPLVRSKI